MFLLSPLTEFLWLPRSSRCTAVVNMPPPPPSLACRLQPLSLKMTEGVVERVGSCRKGGCVCRDGWEEMREL